MEQFFLHDGRFTEAFANTTHVVFGKRLAPFCLWHQLVLELVQSKVLVEKPLTPFDLWVAVRVCTCKWNAAHQLPSFKHPGKMRFLWEAGRFHFPTEVKKFSDYLEDYMSFPKLWPNQHTNKEGAEDRDIDEHFEIVMHLVTATTLTLEQAWTLPIGVARWMSLGALKLTGAKVDVWTPDHQARYEVHVKNREAKIDERGKEIAKAENLSFAEGRKKANEEYWAQIEKQRVLADLKSKHRSRPPQH